MDRELTFWTAKLELMTLGTRLFTLMRGELVGADSTGNKYYKSGRTIVGRRERRWAIYNGPAEATTVPADWHGWLHHRTDVTGTDMGQNKLAWQRDHLPNLTGTEAAYSPPGHVLKGAKRDKATGDYEAWRP
ncbi:NADH:ubiquinone oxidoreductase subunit NDUFA12 [Alphaproteobacteria bacterium]|nr:NADH:ubiquinone oxidoreductase subunit NDUFA12 [Alphaproteobacteria bacterium]